MKLSLSLKLGIAVVLLFSAVIATCLLWTPLRIRYYTGKLHSDDPKKRVAAVDWLMKMGEKGFEIITEELSIEEEEAEFLKKFWNIYDEPYLGGSHYPLEFAIDADFRKVVELFLDKGIDVNSTYSYPGVGDNTPALHFAIWRRKKEIAELLIKRGADVNSIGTFMPSYRGATRAHPAESDTPLDLAIRVKAPDIARLLRKHGGKTLEEIREQGNKETRK